MRFSDPMPRRRPRIAHYEPSYLGDRPSALATSARRGFHHQDCNFQWAWVNHRLAALGGTAFCLHWETPIQNEYRFIVGRGPRGKVRPMTHAELHRSIRYWPAGQVRRWRRENSKNSQRPVSYWDMATEGKRVGVYVCGELKADAFTRPKVAAQMVRTARKVGHPPLFMALYQMDARHKCAAIRNAGGHFAVIFGTGQSLRDNYRREVSHWARKPSAEW